MQKLFIDWESFYDTKAGYHLNTRSGGISIVEYVRHRLFKGHGFSYAFDNDAVSWVTASKVQETLSSFPWKGLVLIAQNSKFDGFITFDRYGYVPASYICTKAMAKAVIGKRIKSHSLEELSKYFGLIKKDKSKLDDVDGVRDLTGEQEAKLAQYCCDDTTICRDAFRLMEPEFPSSQYRAMSWTIKAFVEPKLVLDVPLLEKTAEEENKRRETIFKEIGISKKEFSSNAKFAKLLISKGYPVPTKASPRTGKLIPALARGDTGFLDLCQTDNYELKLLCEARIAAKSNLLETRSTKLAKIGATGPWPFDVEFSGADQTHRYSGGSGAGGNPQNFTRGSNLRKAVRAPEGYKLVVGDFSKVEPRLSANLAKDEALLAALAADPYLDFASAYFGRKLDKHKDDGAYRFGKEAILGLGYGLGWKKFKDRIKLKLGKSLTDDEAKKAVEFYRYRYRRIPELWRALGSSIALMLSGKEGRLLDLPIRYGREHLMLPSGLKLQYPGLRQEPGKQGPEWVYDVYDKGKLEKKRLYGGKLLENICQALAGELTKAAIEKLEDYAYGQVHDEAILVVPEQRADSIAEAMELIMSESPSWLPTMKLGSEVKVASNWLEAK